MSEPENPQQRRGSEPPTPPEGFVSRHRFTILTTALALAFLLAGTGAVYAGIAVSGKPAVSTPPQSAGAPEESVTQSRAVPEILPTPVALRTCSVAELADDERFMKLYGSVINADTGEVLYAKRADELKRPGSGLKVLTAVAAIDVLGPDYRLTTQVVDSPVPGSVVLVGGGDATLSRLAPGEESFYPGAPRISELAAQTLAAYNSAHPGVPITEVVLDANYWNPSDSWDAGWKRSEQETGYQSEVTALQVDGDREDPATSTSPRSTDPIGRAGAEFVSALGLEGVTVREGFAENGAPVLASVQSKTVKTLVKQMLLTSDNTLAEMLARVVSKESGLDGSAASLDKAFSRVLDKYGMDSREVTIRDGSGLSDDNAVSAGFMAEFMIKVADEKKLKDVFAGLSVAGKTGSLATRFTGDSAVAVGHVYAKTGWLETAYTLSGYIDAEDESRLTFAFYALGEGITEGAKQAIDGLVAGVYACGDNLSNN